jgi:hypothetical protein
MISLKWRIDFTFVGVIAVLVFMTIEVQAQEVTCGYCIEMVDLCFSQMGTNPPGFQRPAREKRLYLNQLLKWSKTPTSVAPFRLTPCHRKEWSDYVRTSHVCKGAVMRFPTYVTVKVAPTATNREPSEFDQNVLEPTGDSEIIASLGVCDGELVLLDNYRKEIARQTIAEEIKKFAERFNDERIATILKSELKEQYESEVASLSDVVMKKVVACLEDRKKCDEQQLSP